MNIPNGYDFGKNECSHINHYRNSPDYQNPDNGKYLNRPQHWIRHRLAELGEIDNGLNPNQNKRARKLIWGREEDDEKFYTNYIAHIE